MGRLPEARLESRIFHFHKPPRACSWRQRCPEGEGHWVRSVKCIIQDSRHWSATGVMIADFIWEGGNDGRTHGCRESRARAGVDAMLTPELHPWRLANEDLGKRDPAGVDGGIGSADRRSFDRRLDSGTPPASGGLSGFGRGMAAEERRCGAWSPGFSRRGFHSSSVHGGITIRMKAYAKPPKAGTPNGEGASGPSALARASADGSRAEARSTRREAGPAASSFVCLV